jgi:outer membrane protein OmpA-like peptidoglycan-associated protein
MKRCLSLGILGCCLLARSAVAQENSGFALDRFEPAERGSDWFAADSLDIRGKSRLILGATGDWAYKPLVLYAPNGDEQTAVIRHQFFTHLGAAFVLADRLRLGVNLPIALYQAGDAAALDGVTYASDNATRLGDLRLAADLRLVGEYRGPFELAIGAAVYLPTGKKESYTGDGKARVAPRLLVAGELGAFVYAARAGFLYRANDEGFAGASKSNEVFGAAAVGLRIANEKLVIGPELYGSTSTASGDFFARRTSPFEVLFGAHYQVSSEWRIGAGVGPGLTRGVGAPQVRGLLSIEWAPAVEQPSDRDGDGVLDVDDYCPNVPGEASDDPRKNGCPIAPGDRDKDGILDVFDACADEPGVKTDDPKTNGCPVVAPPPLPPSDRDQDGIIDDLDACVDEPGVKTNDPKTNGCPPPRDRDKDGIIDELDACPDVPGPANEDPKKNGCPAARIEQGQIKILGRVEFENNSSKISPESEPILNAVLEVMQEHPEFTKLGVEGHTDNRGAAAYNKRLSQQRAQSVMKWLTSHGIAAKRLSAAGFGMERPIDNNDSDAGRQNNRRVEFHIQAVDGKPAVTAQ